MKKERTYQPELPGLDRTQRTPTQPTPRGLPDWLRRQIEIQAPNTFGKLARWDACPRCRQLTLAGWDAYDDYAGHYHLDPAYLTTDQETWAASTGRTTFRLIIDRGDKTIFRRSQWERAAKPADTLTQAISPLHRCGAPLGAIIPPSYYTKGTLK